MMSPWLEAAFAKYGWIWIGLSFGFLAKYALLIKQGVRVKARLIIADLLLLPMVALIAYTAASRAGLEGEFAAMVSAFSTVGMDRLVKLLTERFWMKVEAVTLREVARDVVEARGEFRQVDQMRRSAETAAGSRANDGDDHEGRYVHRIGPAQD